MSHAPKESFLCKNEFVQGQLEENGGDFDLVGIWKNSSETQQKQFRIFLSTFFSSLGWDGSNGTPFDAVGLILSLTHPLQSPNLIE